MSFGSRTISKKRNSSSKTSSLKFKPRKYQERAIRHVIKNPEAGLFLAPGLGKTSITLSVLRILKARGDVGLVILVSGRRIIHRVWPKEITKWGFGLRYGLLHGGTREQVWRDKNDYDVVACTYEGVPWVLNRLKKERKRPCKVFDFVVLDESSKIKNGRALRSRAMHKLRKGMGRALILSGSGASKGLMGVHNQIKFLDYGERLGQFVTGYRNSFFTPSGFEGNDWIPTETALDEISESISDIVLTLRHEGNIDLPPLHINDIDVELPPKARKIYDKVEKDFIADVETGRVVAVNAGVAVGKMRQMAGGIVFKEDGLPELIHEAKKEALVDLHEELRGSPILVAVGFIPEAEMLCREFSAPYLGGGVSDKKADKIIDQWNDGQLGILFAHPTSVAHGLNLQEGPCRDLCYYTLPLGLEDYEQFYQRVHRQGVGGAVTIHRLLAEDTYDQRAVEILEHNDYTQQSFLKCLEKHYGIKISKKKASRR